MKAVKILKALCYEGWNVNYCNVFTTSDTPLDDLQILFHFDSYEGNPESNTTFFYYWSFAHIEESTFDKPDLILYRKDIGEKIYLWKIE